jgi:hypothetical protein
MTDYGYLAVAVVSTSARASDCPKLPQQVAA